MIVVGLSGKSGQGKSTLGAMLRKLAEVDYRADLESSYPITEVANAWLGTWPTELLADQDMTKLANQLIETFPQILKQLTGKTASYDAMRIADSDESHLLNQRLLDYLEKWVQLSDEERREKLPLPINPGNKGLHRALFQWIGGSTVETVSPTIWSDLIDRRIKDLASRGYKLVTVGGIRYGHDAAVIHGNGGVIVHVTRPEAGTADVAITSDVTETSMDQFEADVEVVNNGTLEQLQIAAEHLYADLRSNNTRTTYSAV